jgi:hypothetical protein
MKDRIFAHAPRGGVDLSTVLVSNLAYKIAVTQVKFVESHSDTFELGDCEYGVAVDALLQHILVGTNTQTYKQTTGSQPLDLWRLQELVMAGITLMLFVSRQAGHVDHPKLITLRKLVMEAFATVPLVVFFDVTSPVAAYCFREHADTVVPVLIHHEKGLEAIQTYVTHWSSEHNLGRPPPPSGIEITKGTKRPDNTLGWMETLRKTVDTHFATSSAVPLGGAAPRDNILTLLARCVDPAQSEPEQGFTVMLNVLAGPLQQAREAMQASLTTEAYGDFISALAFALITAQDLVKALGDYFSPAQNELNPLNYAMGVFLVNRYVKKAVQVVSSSLTGEGSAMTRKVAKVAPLASASVTLSEFAGLAASAMGLGFLFDGFPSDVINSSAGLCAKVLAHLKVSVAEGATNSEMQAALARELVSTHGFGPFGDAAALSQLLSDCFPFVTKTHEQFPDVLRRLKLIVLCDALRTALQQLPIALLTGPTRSGKSTFREYMQSRGPDRTRFGVTARQRTAIPELFFCGEEDRPIGLLDTIGFGDPTNSEAFAAIEQANKFFQLFCQASVIVVNESDISLAGRNLMYRTSAVAPRAGLLRATLVHHPTITCFTNADKMLSVGGVFPECEDGPATLLQEAKDRLVRGEPFDLRSPEEDSFAPRVLACFEGRIQVPEEYNGVVYTTKQVKEWLYSHFYPDR